MKTDQPLISVGVPVYNDALWLRNALNHLLAQDYKNLEIIIADNGSTDGSREICHEYVQRDSRIRLLENKHNLGSIENHKLVCEVSRGDYFTWGSGHDYFEPSFIRRMMDVLQREPSVVMCCVQAVTEDSSGKVLSISTGGLDTRGLVPVERFRHLLQHQRMGGTMNIFHGLYRVEKLLQLKGFGLDVAGMDAIMLGELSLVGDIVQVNEILHHRIETWSPPADTDGFDTFRAWLKKLGISQGDNKQVPILTMIYEYIRMIDTSKLSAGEKEQLREDIQKMAVDWSPFIQREVDQLVRMFKEEVSTLEHGSLFMQVRAIQVLAILERAWLLGFDRKGIHQARALCLDVIGLHVEARIAAKTEATTHWAELISMILRTSNQKITELYKSLDYKGQQLRKHISFKK